MKNIKKESFLGIPNAHEVNAYAKLYSNNIVALNKIRRENASLKRTIAALNNAMDCDYLRGDIARLQKDFYSVGDDLRRAMERYERQERGRAKQGQRPLYAGGE